MTDGHKMRCPLFLLAGTASSRFVKLLLVLCSCEGMTPRNPTTKRKVELRNLIVLYWSLQTPLISASYGWHSPASLRQQFDGRRWLVTSANSGLLLFIVRIDRLHIFYCFLPTEQYVELFHLVFLFITYVVIFLIYDTNVWFLNKSDSMLVCLLFSVFFSSLKIILIVPGVNLLTFYSRQNITERSFCLLWKLSCVQMHHARNTCSSDIWDWLQLFHFLHHKEGTVYGERLMS